jgi:ADP-ribose pyrophosphatase YjhB (NUDIX family)
MVDPDAELARLEAEHGDVPTVEAAYEVPPLEFERLATADERGALGGARAVVRRGDAVLLVRTVDAPDEWAAPGGERDPGEDHEATAVRAAEQETGLDVALGPLLAAARYTFRNEDTDDAVTGLWTWFGAADAGGRPAPDSSVLSAGWFTEFPEDVNDTVAGAARAWMNGSRSGDDASGAGSAAADD